MNTQQFKDLLKNRTFNAINETYNSYKMRSGYDWSEQQHRIVIRYVNSEINILMNENNDKFPINEQQSERMISRFVDMLMNIIFDPDNINTPENMIESLELQLQHATGEGVRRKKTKRRKTRRKKTKRRRYRK
jgi:hypothetical protein